MTTDTITPAEAEPGLNHATSMALVENVKEKTVRLQLFNVGWTSKADFPRPRINDVVDCAVPISDRFPAQWWEQRKGRGPIMLTYNWKTSEVIEVRDL